MDEREFAARALHREAQAQAEERKMAERIAMRLAHEKAAQAADLQRQQMKQWQDEARRGR